MPIDAPVGDPSGGPHCTARRALHGRRLRSVVAMGLCVAVIWQLAVSAGATTPDPIRTVFNDPRDEDRRGAISDELKSLIRNAPPGSSIKIAIWEFNDASITKALLDAHDRKVQVQVLADANRQAHLEDVEAEKKERAEVTEWAKLRTGLSDPRNNSWARLCANQRGRAGCIGSRMMHNKFAIFSKLNGRERVADFVVFQSSANFNPRGSGDGMWNNSVTVMNNAKLYGSFAQYFSLLANRTSTADFYKVRERLDTVPGAVSPIYFPEEEGDEILRILDDVRCAGTGTTIRLAAATFSRQAVAKKLWDMDNAGCDVHVVYKLPATVEDAIAIQSELARRTGPYPEMHLSMYPDCGPLHSKYLAIEGHYKGKSHQKVVWTGSPNFTEPALKNNDEALLRIADPETHDEFRANFEDLVRDVDRYRNNQRTGWPFCAKNEGDSGSS